MPPTTEAVRKVEVTHPASAPPFARALAQQISLHARTELGRQQLTAFQGVVGVRSATDHQKATIRSSEHGIDVTHGIASDIDLEITVDVSRRDAVLSHVRSNQSGPTSAAVEALLNPELPSWCDLADAFWAAAQTVPGMPSLRLVECNDGESIEREQTLGDRARVYEIWGKADVLARLLAGLDFFADTVFAGDLNIKGTFSDFSVVSGGSMRVMWHV